MSKFKAYLTESSRGLKLCKKAEEWQYDYDNREDDPNFDDQKEDLLKRADQLIADFADLVADYS